MTDDGAVTLFDERAAAIRPDRPLGPHDREAVLEICHRLDGLPLAIELAAARTRALSPRQIVIGLKERFELLANGPRTVPARHATLRASMDWSYDLLGEHEGALLRRVGVFAGGFDLEAALSVCPEANVEQLAALVDRSLVAAADGPDASRYGLLETVRSYAVEHLVVAGERDQAGLRHRDYFLGLAETAEPMMSGSQQQQWIDRLAVEYDNMVAALAFSRDQPHPEHLARLAVALTPYGWRPASGASAGLWLDAAKEAGELSPKLRPQVLICLCYLETWLGHLVVVVASLAAEALTLARSTGAQREEGRALAYLAVITALAMGADPARPYFEQAMALATSVRDTWGVANLYTFFSLSRLFQAEPDEPKRLLDEAITLAREQGDGRTLRCRVRSLLFWPQPRDVWPTRTRSQRRRSTPLDAHNTAPHGSSGWRLTAGCASLKATSTAPWRPAVKVSRWPARPANPAPSRLWP